MRLKVNNTVLALTLILLSVIQCQIAAAYRTEVEITPSPIEEPTTKKSGFFGGIKNFFRGSPTTTTTVAPVIEVTTPKSVPVPQAPKQNVPPPNAATTGQKPPPLIIPQVPLVPLGPRPDTPPSSPLAGSPQQQPQWPQAPGQGASTTTGRPAAPQQFPQQPQQPQNAAAGGAATFGGNQRPGAQQNLPPGFTPYRPARPQPSGLDLSYGGATGGRPQGGVQPGFGLAPLTSSTTTTTTTTTTTPKPAPQSPMNFDLRMGGTSPSVIPGAVSTTTTPRSPQIKEDFPALPAPRRPSTGAKEDFPALPVPKSPTPTPASPSSPQRPSSPSAWSGAATPSWGTPGTPAKPAAPTPTPDRVSFVPHAPGSATTVRPGFENSGNSVATDAEIEALTEILYTKETNSQLNLIRINLQGKTRSIDSTDEAPQPLLQVDPKALEPPTIAKLRLLFNNYEQDTLTNEHVTPNERLEENDFVDTVMATSVMRQAMLFLQNKGIVSPDPKTHRDLVKELWFTQYSRGSGKIGSSGFEHVFVNEVKNGTIIGLHNWVYFDEEEKAGRLNYMGYMNAIDLGTKGKVIKMRFNHNGLKKPVNTLFAGTSPELELALYTVCFKLRPDRTCPVSLGNSKFGIVTYSWRYRGKSLIGSAFPEI